AVACRCHVVRAFRHHPCTGRRSSPSRTRATPKEDTRGFRRVPNSFVAFLSKRSRAHCASRASGGDFTLTLPPNRNHGGRPEVFVSRFGDFGLELDGYESGAPRSDSKQRREVVRDDFRHLRFGHLPELRRVARRACDVRGLARALLVGAQIRAVGLEQEAIAWERLEHAREALGAPRVGRDGQVVAGALGDLASQAHLAPEAVPIDATRAELVEDFEGAALALPRVDDDGLVGIESEPNELAKDGFLFLPERLGHPVPVETDLADRKGALDVLLEPRNALLGRELADRKS